MSFDRLRRDWLSLLIGFLLAVGGSTGAVTLIDDDEDGKPDHIEITIDGPDRDTAQDDTVALGEAGARALTEAEQESVGPHPNTRDETPTGSPIAAPGVDLRTSPNADAREVFRQSQEAAKETTTGSDAIPDKPRTLAAQSVPGCRTRFVSNQSSRNGARPAVIVAHYTVSTNRTGWGDVDGLTAYADSPRSGVSWHFLIDREGHCNYTVPLVRKAWTQAAANPFAIGVEMIGTGREPDWGGTAGLRKFRSVSKHVSRLYGIPLRRGDHQSCRLARSGIFEHRSLGICGGGHHDISPYSIDRIISYVQGADAKPPSASARRQCQRIRAYRRKSRRPGGLNGTEKRTNRRLRGNLERHGYRCLATKVVRKAK